MLGGGLETTAHSNLLRKTQRTETLMIVTLFLNFDTRFGHKIARKIVNYIKYMVM